MRPSEMRLLDFLFLFEEPFVVRPQVYFEAPGALVLLCQVPIGLGDGIGVEQGFVLFNMPAGAHIRGV